MKIDLGLNSEFAIKAEGEKKLPNGNHAVYKCPAGYDTVGHGFNIEKNKFPVDIAKKLLIDKINQLKDSDIGEGNYTLLVGYDIEADGLPDWAAKELLARVLNETQTELIKNLSFWHKLDFTRKAVLVDMSYNMGWPTLSTFKNMLSALDEGDYEEAAKQQKDSKWYEQVGFRSKKLNEAMRTGKWQEY